MAIKKTSESDELKMVYQEIIEGCSYITDGFFIKHLCEIEQIEVVRKRIEFVNNYIKNGIPTEEDILTRLKTNGEWTDEKDSDIQNYRLIVSDNEKLLPSIHEWQKPGLLKVIEENKKSLIELLIERKHLIGTTAEDLSEKDGTNFLAYLTLYKDRNCSQPLFSSWEEFEMLEENESNPYLSAINNTMERINEVSIRRIAALPFFLNTFSYCKDAPYTFLNKPLYRLTNYQVHLFSLGIRNLNLLSQVEGNPPDYTDGICDQIVKWYDTQYSIVLSKRKQANNS